MDMDNNEKLRFFDVISLPEGTFAPASVESAILVESEDGEKTLRFFIRRDLNVPLRSFVLSYRFSDKPFGEDDADNPFFNCVYKSESINKKEYISFRGKVPEDYAVDGCQSFISSVELADGGTITFSPADLIGGNGTAGDKPADQSDSPEAPDSSDAADGVDVIFDNKAEKSAKDSAEKSGGADIEYDGKEAESDDAGKPDVEYVSDGDKADNASEGIKWDNSAKEGVPEADANAEKHRHHHRRSLNPAYKTRIIITVICICLLGAGLCFGIYYQRTGSKATVDGLRREMKYAEAYKVAERCRRSDLQKEICAEASQYYLEKGDYANAFAFAYASPDRFSDEIAVEALDKLVASDAKAMDTELFAVAKKLSNDERFDESMIQLAKRFASEKDYPSAMRAATSVRTESKQAELSEKIFLEGIGYYTSDTMYKNAVAFIHSYGKGKSSDGSVSADTVSSIVEHCISIGDKASAIMLSDYFKLDYSGIEIAPGEESITGMLDSVYPLLTPAQKRAYHAKPFSFYKEPFIIKDGALEGTAITDAVSVDTYEYHTVILHRDGKITSLENGGHNVSEQFPAKEDAVQVATGLLHTVILYSNGTVIAVGDNTYRQCEVGAWTDIVAVDAGRFFTVGLKADGTVVATGSDQCGQCNVSDLKNVKWIGCCDQTTVVRFTDDTVRVRGSMSGKLRNANDFTDVKRISAGGSCIVIEKKDGTFDIADGCIMGSSGNVSGFTDIASFVAGEAAVAYVGNDGAISFTGDGAPK